MTEPAPQPATPHDTHAPHAHLPVRILWWAYFVLIALNWLFTVFHVQSLPDVLQLVFWGVGLIGLFGYLQRKAVGWRMLWIVYLPLDVAWLLVAVIVMFRRHPDAGLMPSLLAILMIVLLSGPLIWALWRYAFRSPGLWRRAHRPKAAP